MPPSQLHYSGFSKLLSLVENRFGVLGAAGGVDAPALSARQAQASAHGVEKVLRVYFLRQWYGLADEALEDSIYGSQAMHDFAGIDLGGRGSVPYATIIASPSSTKNRSGERDPEKYR